MGNRLKKVLNPLSFESSVSLTFLFKACIQFITQKVKSKQQQDVYSNLEWIELKKSQPYVIIEILEAVFSEIWP